MQVQATHNAFRDYGGVKKFSGRIATVQCLRSNPLVRQRLTKEAGHGRVLVVDGGADLSCALMGDQLASGAVENGWNVSAHCCYCISSNSLEGCFTWTAIASQTQLYLATQLR